MGLASEILDRHYSLGKPDTPVAPSATACSAAIGSWPADCRQRAFVEGAAWWQFTANGSTMFPAERDMAEKEAVRRFGVPLPEKASAHET